MKKIIRFFDMTIAIPMKDGETVEQIEDKLFEAVETVGARFTSYKTEIEEREFIINSNYPQSIQSMEEAGYRELVRCKDCEHSKSYSNGTMFGCEFGNGLREPDWFCADGTRKDS